MVLRKYFVPTMILLTTVSSGLSNSLYAGDINYSFIEGRYILDADVVGADGDGFRLAGSYLITGDVYAFGSYDTVDLENSSVDIKFFKMGGGYIFPLDTSWDANFSLAYAKAEADGHGGNADESGFELSGGVRGMINSQVELHAKVNYLDLDESDTYFTIGGDYFFMPNISAGIEVDTGGDYETLSIGAKYYF